MQSFPKFTLKIISIIVLLFFRFHMLFNKFPDSLTLAINHLPIMLIVPVYMVLTKQLKQKRPVYAFHY